MEQQIQDLIASIKKDGIEKAKEESDRIIADANKKASDIIASAKAQSEKMLQDARKQIEIETSSSNAAIKQAARDVSLSLKKEIEGKFNELLEIKLEKELHGDVLAKCIEFAIKADNNPSDVDIELSKDDFSALEKTLSKSFAKEISEGLEFKVSPVVASGFRVVQKDGEAYLDYSAQSCTELLMPYLSDSLKGII